MYSVKITMKSRRVYQLILSWAELVIIKNELLDKENEFVRAEGLIMNKENIESVEYYYDISDCVKEKAEL